MKMHSKNHHYKVSMEKEGMRSDKHLEELQMKKIGSRAMHLAG